MHRNEIQWYVSQCPDPAQMARRPLDWWQRETRAVQPTLIEQHSLWHTSCTHLLYDLTCTDFELLLAEAGYACKRCGLGSDFLHVDHDHSRGSSAVRHLLCPKCNAHLKFVDHGRKPADPLTEQYLASPYERRHTFKTYPAFGEAALRKRRETCLKAARKRRKADRAIEIRDRRAAALGQTSTCSRSEVVA